MPSGKNRLYVALYARGGGPKMSTLEDTYHWALIIGPKNDSGDGSRFHAKEGLKADRSIGWIFEEKDVSMKATQMLLVRICVGKIEKNAKVKDILRDIPIRDTVDGWNCVYWVKEALERLSRDNAAMGTSELDWETVRTVSMRYVAMKKDQHRFDGQGDYDTSKPATFDLLERVETVL